MNIELINETKYNIDTAIFQELYNIVSKYEKIEEDTQLCLVLADNEKIKEYNRRFRGKNSVTDVLTFKSEIPQIPFLGDIIIDIEVAQSQKGNRSLEEELIILFLHGLLHLLDYDHIKSEDAIIMKEREKKYIILFSDSK